MLGTAPHIASRTEGTSAAAKRRYLCGAIFGAVKSGALPLSRLKSRPYWLSVDWGGAGG
jgi:hypothetical protein